MGFWPSIVIGSIDLFRIVPSCDVRAQLIKNPTVPTKLPPSISNSVCSFLVT